MRCTRRFLLYNIMSKTVIRLRQACQTCGRGPRIWPHGHTNNFSLAGQAFHFGALMLSLTSPLPFISFCPGGIYSNKRRKEYITTNKKIQLIRFWSDGLLQFVECPLLRRNSYLPRWTISETLRHTSLPLFHSWYCVSHFQK